MRLLVAALPFLAAACAVTQSGGPVLPGRVDAPPPPLVEPGEAPLVGTLWSWQGTLMSDDTRHVPDAPGKYTLRFDAGGRVAVRADCNRGTGPYTRDGNRLSFGPIALTRAMCEPGSRDAEFVKGLQNVDGHLFRGGELVLTLKFDSGSMLFAAVRP